MTRTGWLTCLGHGGKPDSKTDGRLKVTKNEQTSQHESWPQERTHRSERRGSGHCREGTGTWSSAVPHIIAFCSVDSDSEELQKTQARCQRPALLMSPAQKVIQQASLLSPSGGHLTLTLFPQYCTGDDVHLPHVQTR